MTKEKGTERSYELSVKGDGISIEKSISEGTAREIIALVMGGSSPAVAARAAGIIAGASVGKRTSLREYMDNSGARRNPEKIVAIGAYLERELGLEGFTRARLRLEFKSAGEPVPANYTRDFNWAVTNGWLYANPSAPKEYYVTNKGHEAIAAQFSSDVRKSTRLSRSNRRRTRR